MKTKLPRRPKSEKAEKVDPGLRKEMLKDLERSGLYRIDADRMGLRPVSAAEAKWLGHDHRPGYLIPYFGPDGKRRSKDFDRIRYLSVTGTQHRYGQLKDTPPQVYFPTTLNGGWEKLIDDPTKPIVITEGEKKAAKACKEGIATIGLGGVWSFKSKRWGKEFLDDLERIKWKGRSVEIVYDSDILIKPNVHLALTELSRLLLDRGAAVSVVSLAAKDDEKVGLDDFLIAHGRKAYDKLDRQRDATWVKLDAFNAKWSHVEGLGFFNHLRVNCCPRSSSTRRLATRDRSRPVQPKRCCSRITGNAGRTGRRTWGSCSSPANPRSSITR